VATKKLQSMQTQVDQPDRFRLSEMGNLGLSVFGGVTDSDLRSELNFPASIITYKKMSAHSAINSALTLFDNIVGKAKWNMVPPKDASEEEKRQCKIVEEMMHDMEGTWPEFIRDVLSMNMFGFSVHEKVYRKRYTSNGSKYNDGIIGWKKLPIRAQETIEKFIFSPDGNDILGVKQNLSGISDQYNRFSGRESKEVVLPRSKIMLFRSGKHRGDPFGKSPLRDAYLAWRFLTALEDLEATSVSKDVSGIPVLSIPPQYLSEDASPSQKAIKVYYENALRNLQMNQQTAFLLPLAYDEVSLPLGDNAVPSPAVARPAPLLEVAPVKISVCGARSTGSSSIPSELRTELSTSRSSSSKPVLE